MPPRPVTPQRWPPRRPPRSRTSRRCRHSRTHWRECWRLGPRRPGQGGSEQAARDAAARAAHRPVPRSAPLGSRSGFLSYPVNAPVSSEFGMRFHPVMQRYRLHAGIDFAANCGSPVYAAADGDVIMATPESASGGYGNRLVIDHGLLRGVDLTTTYNHLTSFVVTGGPCGPGPARGLLRHDRVLDRLSPALRDPSGRHPGQPASLALTPPLLTSGRFARFRPVPGPRIGLRSGLNGARPSGR